MKTTFLLTLQFGRYFSHFGLRGLLLLYLVEGLGSPDASAFRINALFAALAELGAVFGGVIADRYLGLKRSLYLGALFLLFGYIAISFQFGLLLALTSIVFGSSLFSGNLQALFGLSLKEENRSSGFTKLYRVQNLGALLGTSLTGLIAHSFGFSVGFMVAAGGIVLINTILLFTYKTEPEKPQYPMKALGLSLGFIALVYSAFTFEAYASVLLPFATALTVIVLGRNLIKKTPELLIYLFALVLFFAVEDQILSSLLLFFERYTTHAIGGFSIPSSSIIAMNPIVIVLLGHFAAKRGFSLGLPFFLAGIGFAALGCLLFSGMQYASLGVLSLVSLISFAELMIGPVVISYTAKISAQGSPGTVMSLIPLSFSLAYQVSGFLGASLTPSGENPIHAHGTHFIAIGVLLAGAALALTYALKRTRKVITALSP